MGKLKGKIALITGGASGIGLASAKAFVAEGAQVVITGRDQAAIDVALAEIGERAMGVRGDVSNLADLDRLYSEIGKRLGHLDIVFANAGALTLAPFEDITEVQFNREFDINAKGVFFTVQKALPLLKDGGSVILTSSIAHFKGTPGYNVYAATKAAVRSFARSWTVDLKHRNIRVNCLSPGPTITPLAGKMGIPAEQAESYGKYILEQIPMGRFGNAEETAKAALFLASDDSSFITGVDLCVDGGMGQI
ncbi:glucose 1-dehydrogenase [Methylovorus mays]|uniref:glucose 1-dehydrogenase n=1 Tax=Methylovorus mays TaxID=184077 RepID=UPI001E2C2D0A|nr:glucose 1-dehydrogenase [Methylovorus mays]MCB5206795.1 SDR family oxidoreductase [Methylovorus mays]